ncbi:unnamed protein product [Bursaphelenchus xylophilus]|uniref:(pine wood nematode) hypothetical protein n=1 Tax=Bursaphelenchus xylophilus TaxID=6326 RepID=A0A7I8WU63_BURXY|nr:unnamed protein product [Bursaphelenchus xylophilus]CAG9116535.1 unnamed protein product [Bursaphelenchus xylophilus]
MNSNEVLQGSDRIRVLEKICQRDTDRQAVEELKKIFAEHHNCSRNRINLLIRKIWKLNGMIFCREGASSEITVPSLNPPSSQYKDKHLRLLAEIVERLDRLEKRDQQSSFPWKNEANALYRVVELTESYELCVKALLERIESINKVCSMPALICHNDVVDGIYSVEEVDRVIHVLEVFAKKLANYLANTRFAGNSAS